MLGKLGGNIKVSADVGSGKVEAKASLNTDVKVEAKIETPKVEAKIDANVGVKAEAKVDAKVEAKIETPKVQAKVETPKANVSAEVNGHTNGKVDAKLEAPKVDVNMSANAEKRKAEKKGDSSSSSDSASTSDSTSDSGEDNHDGKKETKMEVDVKGPKVDANINVTSPKTKKPKVDKKELQRIKSEFLNAQTFELEAEAEGESKIRRRAKVEKLIEFEVPEIKCSAALWAAATKAHPEKKLTAKKESGFVSVSFKDFSEKVNQLAKGLLDLGLAPKKIHRRNLGQKQH